MFTGIIEATGKVVELRRGGGAHRLVVSTSLGVEALPIGASLAVNGVCLTVVQRGRGRVAADLGPETLARTTLGDLEDGALVHLERPLAMGGALGGHLVSGHVDAVGRVVARTPRGEALDLVIEAPASLLRYVVPKGSVAVDGVSLTVNAVRGRRFTVTLIPHTLAVTTLGAKAPGARVNIEADIIAKHVERLLAGHTRVLRAKVRA